ncbi:exported hypothetical protein [Mesorhizobium plurifarium]|uniref:Filamentous haemagglutinin FhaB/tRNA nuclease CdiA-like TPS domain-containing protein n=1 Tax=Mesorhizobium plurifarium TaxID=69974 RepID=A0A090E2T5_MESPL|nr:exported hypothetical protein [Mesorhizobium plurifarium]
MRFWRICLATTALVPLSFGPLWANPLGGTVVDGGASIQGMGTPQVTVTQTTDRAALEWRSFDIEQGETTRFVQPSADSVILNRVTGGQNASHIYGTLESNGTVYLVNPDGILFGPSAVVDTGSFLATTHDIKNSDFMAGIDQFSARPGTNASVVNEGTITAHDGGFAALVAPGVRNDGVIVANLGTVGMSAIGDTFSLDLRGDQLINFAVSDQIAEEVKDARTGQPLKSFVENTGKIKANGGRVELTAATARKVVDSVINNSGVLEANTVSSKGGKIILGAATSNAKGAVAAKQIVKSSGKISARGKKSGEKGGKIQITGEVLALQGAKIDAGGDAGGGTVLIGGDYHGGQPVANAPIAMENKPVPNADFVYVDNATMVDASAYSTGNGGKVIFWGNQANHFAGNVTATGGSANGNGGFVEVSSPLGLGFDGRVDTTAAHGQTGKLLLDPDSLTIDDTDLNYTTFGLNGITLLPSNHDNADTASHVSASTIETLLNTSNVEIFITRPFSSGSGSLNINSNIVAPANDSALDIESSDDYSLTINLNATLDFSQSTGYIMLGNNLAPAQSISVGPAGKIIGNINNIYFNAYSIGSAAAPIPVEIVPDSDATTANYAHCANGQICSDTGTRLLSATYAPDSTDWAQHVFFAISLRPGYTVPTPGGSGGDPSGPNGGSDGQIVANNLTHPDEPTSIFSYFNAGHTGDAAYSPGVGVLDGKVQGSIIGNVSYVHGALKKGNSNVTLDILAAEAKINAEITSKNISVGGAIGVMLADANASYLVHVKSYDVNIMGNAGIGAKASGNIEIKHNKMSISAVAGIGGVLGIHLSIERSGNNE